MALKKHGKILLANGDVGVLFPANGKYFNLQELQAIVGGEIEIVVLSDGRYMVLHGEGKLLGLPFNAKATKLFNAGGRLFYDPIAGDVLVCDESLLEPDEIDDDEPGGDAYFDV